MQASVVLGNDAQPRSAPDARKSGARWRLRTMARTFRAAPSGAADWHPPDGRRFAPPIMRLERTGGPASKLAVPPAAHPPPPLTSNEQRSRRHLRVLRDLIAHNP